MEKEALAYGLYKIFEVYAGASDNPIVANTDQIFHCSESGDPVFMCFWF